MFFQVHLTPKSRRLKRPESSQGHECKKLVDYSLVLDRFQPPTRIELETEINSGTECYLNFQNISDKSLNLMLTKEPPKERCIGISSYEFTVGPQSSEKITITWVPRIEGSSRDVIQFLDDRRIKYDVAIITCAKNSKKVKKKIPRIPLSKMPESNWSNTILKSGNNKIEQPSKLRTQSSIEKKSEKENFFAPRASAPQDFSKLLDSSGFHLTPSRKNSISTIDDNDIPSARSELFPQPLRTLNSENPETLRRETYYIKRSQELNNIVTIDEENENEFEDSLSPIKSDTLNKVNATFDIVPTNSTFEITNSSSPLQLGDPSSARGIIEADLWAKPIEKLKDLKIMNEITTPVTDRIRARIEPTCLEFSPPVRITRLRKSPPKRIKSTPDKNLLKKKSSTSILIKKHTNIKITELSQTKHPKIESDSKSNDFDHFMSKFYNPDPLAPTTAGDPFLSRKIHYSEQWMHNQEIIFTRWLNTLLSAPEHLTTDVDTACVDIAKVWQSCKMRQDDVLAETKESVSARYHTDTRLNTLRKAARAMFRRQEVVEILSKTSKAIEKGVFIVRTDRDLFRDIGLQKIILELFLSYNPLWLRIGLETVYGETVALSSNQDLIGLTRFLLTRFFSDPFLIKNRVQLYLKEQRSQNLLNKLNKFVLKKFLCLVYFLDYAKMNKLIGHDPCLFYTRSAHKESRSILLTFSREVLSGIGDITKVLRGFDYLVHYRQTRLDEFNFAVANISVDLRDGVRLCRLMELITGVRDLTKHCRIPANSRLQKLHNVDVGLKALKSTRFVLDGDIDAKSIVEGHREKTLSLLWQIVYKYQLPRFEKAALVIQKWWKGKLLYVRVKNYLKERRTNAARIVQRAWKLYKVKQEFIRLNYEKIQTVVFVQSRWRGKRERRNFHKVRNAVARIQKFWRNLKGCRADVKLLRDKRNAVVVLQTRWRATLRMRIQRKEYLNCREKIAILQSRWRDWSKTRSTRREFIQLKNAAICIQRKWRGLREKREQLRSIEKIEIWWKSILVGRRMRIEFLLRKKTTLAIERWWDGILLARAYRKKRASCIKIQSYWRMIIVKRKYDLMIEQRGKAVILLQRRLRATFQMRIQRNYYRELKKHTVRVQNTWRANKIGLIVRNDYSNKRKAAIVVQKHWRAFKCRKQYQALKKSTVVVQRVLRALAIRKSYLKLKKCAIFVQEKWRGKLAMREARQSLVKYRENVVKVQSYWRMKIERRKFVILKNAAIIIQTRLKALIVGRRIRIEYVRLKSIIVRIQRRYRLIKLEGIKCNVAAKKIQIWWRYKLVKKIWPYLVDEKSLVIMKREYTKHVGAAIKIQNWWRLELQKQKEYHRRLHSVGVIETWWLGILRWRKYNCAVIKIQACWRGYRIRKAQDSEWIELRLRSVEATKAAVPTKTLAYRSQESINMFCNAKNVGQLIFSLLSLDTITKLLPEKCKHLCEIGLHKSLYDILSQSNRSLPWITVCLHTTNILISLAEYPASKNYVIEKQHCLAVINQINSSVENSKLSFGYLKLLLLLVQDEECIQEIKSNSSTVWLLKSAYSKIMRKSKMECTKINQKQLPADYVSAIIEAITMIFNHLKIN